MHRIVSGGRHDDGTTLAEVLVAAALAILVGALTMTLFTAGQRSAAQTTGRVQATEGSRVAFDAASRLLRTATPVGTAADPTAFVDAQASEVTFYANIDPASAVDDDPTLVRVYVDPVARTLSQLSTPLDWDATSGSYVAAAAPATTRVLLENVLPSAQPVFSYLEGMSEPPVTSCTTPAGCPLPASPLTVEERRKVRSILVNVTVSTPAVRTGSNVVLSSRVLVPSTVAVTG